MPSPPPDSWRIRSPMTSLLSTCPNWRSYSQVSGAGEHTGGCGRRGEGTVRSLFKDHGEQRRAARGMKRDMKDSLRVVNSQIAGAPKGHTQAKHSTSITQNGAQSTVIPSAAACLLQHENFSSLVPFTRSHINQYGYVQLVHNMERRLKLVDLGLLSGGRRRRVHLHQRNQTQSERIRQIRRVISRQFYKGASCSCGLLRRPGGPRSRHNQVMIPFKYPGP